MGRGKLSLNLIGNRKCRMSTFKKRKSNLMKKAFELSTLCDVGVCVLIHGPSSYSEDDEQMMMKKKTKNDDDQFLSEFHTWPPNRTDVQSLLRACAKNPNFHRRKTFGLGHFFEDRRAKLLAEISKLRQDGHQFLCPNPNPIPIPDHDSETSYLQSLNESQLRGCLDSIDSKLRAASAMLHLMEPDQLDQLLCFDDLDQIGLCLDDLQPLLPEHDHNNDIVEFDDTWSNVLMNQDQFEFDCNVDEHLLLSGMDEFDFRVRQSSDAGERRSLCLATL